MARHKEPVSARAFLARIQKQTGRNDVSFKEYIQELRYNIAIEYGYIMSNVSYDDMVLDLIQLGEISYEVLPLIKFEKENPNEN